MRLWPILNQLLSSWHLGISESKHDLTIAAHKCFLPLAKWYVERQSKLHFIRPYVLIGSGEHNKLLWVAQTTETSFFYFWSRVPVRSLSLAYRKLPSHCVFPRHREMKSWCPFLQGHSSRAMGSTLVTPPPTGPISRHRPDWGFELQHGLGKEGRHGTQYGP